MSLVIVFIFAIIIVVIILLFAFNGIANKDNNDNSEYMNRINMNGSEHPGQESVDMIPDGYEDHLYKLASMISHEDKLRIRKLIEKGAKIKAIQECREATGAGLKDAKDIVDDYMTYLG